MRLHERMAAIMASKLEMSSKMVLTVLASHMSDDEGRPVWPSVETIAAMAGGSKQVVSVILTKLEARGIVVVTAHAVPGRSTARRAIDWEALASASRDSRPQPAKPGARTDDRTLQGPDTEPCRVR